MLEPVLRLEGLRKSFGSLVVTDDVTLDVLPGEMHAIIGPNGAGSNIGTDATGQRHDPVRRRRCDRPAAGDTGVARAIAQLSDHVDPSGISGAR
jgi:ABC-type phosphonate transport system ATPase subunit